MSVPSIRPADHRDQFGGSLIRAIMHEDSIAKDAAKEILKPNASWISLALPRHQIDQVAAIISSHYRPALKKLDQIAILRAALQRIQSNDPETNRQHADEIANKALSEADALTQQRLSTGI